MLELFGRPGRRKAQTRAPKPEPIELPKHGWHLSRRPRSEPHPVTLTRREIEHAVASRVNPGEEGGPVGKGGRGLYGLERCEDTARHEGVQVGQALWAELLDEPQIKPIQSQHQSPRRHHRSLARNKRGQSPFSRG
jgi:hypothetical protein